MRYTYVLTFEDPVRQRDHVACKIGTTEDVDSRLRTLQTGNPSRLFLVALFHGAAISECLLHQWFCDSNIHGEWFWLSASCRAELLSCMSAAELEELSSVMLRHARRGAWLRDDVDTEAMSKRSPGALASILKRARGPFMRDFDRPGCAGGRGGR